MNHPSTDNRYGRQPDMITPVATDLRVRIRVLALVTILVGLAGCGIPRERESAPVIRIAEQHGLAYAPLTLARLRGYVDEELATGRVEWARLGNATAIREAMIAGRLDIGFMGIPPFLIGVDRGMPWRIFTALSRMPMGLVTTHPDRKTVLDLQEGDRIAVPQPGSIQHILLAMAAERLFDEPSRFDNRLVSMAHPDATQAMISGSQITAYLAPPPFLMIVANLPGARTLLTGEEAFGGPFTFIVGVVAAESSAAAHPDTLGAIVRAIRRATDAIERDPDAIEQLAVEYDTDPVTLRAQLETEGVIFADEVTGLSRFVLFMKQTGYLADSFPQSPARLMAEHTQR